MHITLFALCRTGRMAARNTPPYPFGVPHHISVAYTAPRSQSRLEAGRALPWHNRQAAADRWQKAQAGGSRRAAAGRRQQEGGRQTRANPHVAGTRGGGACGGWRAMKSPHACTTLTPTTYVLFFACGNCSFKGMSFGSARGRGHGPRSATAIFRRKAYVWFRPVPRPQPTSRGGTA